MAPTVGHLPVLFAESLAAAVAAAAVAAVAYSCWKQLLAVLFSEHSRQAFPPLVMGLALRFP